MKKYTPTDQNTKDLLKDWTRKNGQNWELFLRYGSNNTITAKTLKQIEEDPETTFKTKNRINCQNYPFYDKHNIKDTVFNDWESSTFYQNFKLNADGLIEVSELPRNTIPYKDYEALAIEKIEKNMKHFIDSNEDIVLMYSQGIDSILLMAYLMKYNALDRTELVYVNNTAPLHKLEKNKGQIIHPFWQWRFDNPDEPNEEPVNKKSFVSNEKNILKFDNNLDLSFEQTLGFKKITQLNMNEETLIKWANTEDAESFFNYQSYEVAEQFKGRPILIGFEGNSVLFHKWEWIRRIGKPIPKDDNYYTQTANAIDWGKEWDNDWAVITWYNPKQRGWDNKTLQHEYSPISDSELMSLLPFVDLESIDPLEVANSTLVKKMIRSLVGDKFDHLIIKEGNNWMNFWNLARIPLSKVKPEFLKLYVNRKSNLHNVAHCKKALMQAKEIDWIFAVDLLQMKFTNKITLLYKDKFSTSHVKIF